MHKFFSGDVDFDGKYRSTAVYLAI